MNILENHFIILNNSYFLFNNISKFLLSGNYKIQANDKSSRYNRGFWQFKNAVETVISKNDPKNADKASTNGQWPSENCGRFQLSKLISTEFISKLRKVTKSNWLWRQSCMTCYKTDISREFFYEWKLQNVIVELLPF